VLRSSRGRRCWRIVSGNSPPCSVWRKRSGQQLLLKVLASVPDLNPDPSDPHVFGPPGSGSFYQLAKMVRKTLIPTVL
jgi:hypothetical protein